MRNACCAPAINVVSKSASSNRIFFIGRPPGELGSGSTGRTCVVVIMSHALYQLSYPALGLGPAANTPRGEVLWTRLLGFADCRPRGEEKRVKESEGTRRDNFWFSSHPLCPT